MPDSNPTMFKAANVAQKFVISFLFFLLKIFFIFMGWGGIFLFFSYYIQHCFICCPSDSTVHYSLFGLLSSCRYTWQGVIKIGHPRAAQYL
jgi:hypothetical protein